MLQPRQLLTDDVDYGREEIPEGLEATFDAAFAASLALPEKQIQQSYRPIIGVHKWFARRPGTLFRNLLLAEFGRAPLRESFWTPQRFEGTIADPFMGGGTPLIEANRLGFNVIGADINPMAYWIVRQSLGELDLTAFEAAAAAVAADVEAVIGRLYETECGGCGSQVPVKYFLWVKTQRCPECETQNDLFPGYLLAENVRHPANVFHCPSCGALTESEHRPSEAEPVECTSCQKRIPERGPASRGKIECRACGLEFRYQVATGGPPEHRLWALEYHCARCKPARRGRLFKAADAADLGRAREAETLLAAAEETLPIPTDLIPPGDESTRLHRWGYQRYRDMFTARQLLGLGSLLARIGEVGDDRVREALLTVFSDSLRYQNLLCRYDTMALKCQDIFSVHGFPVGLVQCEDALLGIPGVGSGAFRHFVEKYKRAKQYCEEPYDTRCDGGVKRMVRTPGERIAADFDGSGTSTLPTAHLHAGSAETVPLGAGTLDGVFTDPPYFDNVQYAELMDFCFVWLRQVVDQESFTAASTRNPGELTGNVTEKRDLEHFTTGLSRVFTHYAQALKPGRPFVFTYHHNVLSAYVPLVVAILDAGLTCTAVLPAPAEMEASLHIAKTGSSILDSVFVCRGVGSVAPSASLTDALLPQLLENCQGMHEGGVRVTLGDIRCLALGHLARATIAALRETWDAHAPIDRRLATSLESLEDAGRHAELDLLPARVLSDLHAGVRPLVTSRALQRG